MPDYRLLATSPTLEGIEKAVNAFWCSDRYRVDPDTLAIAHVGGAPIHPAVRVERIAGTRKRAPGFRFVKRGN
jgi:hypothetical protein